MEFEKCSHASLMTHYNDIPKGMATQRLDKARDMRESNS